MSKKNKKQQNNHIDKNNTQNKLKSNKEQPDISEKEVGNLAECEQTLLNEKDKYIRLYAEFENFRKRTAKEKLELFETAGEAVIKNLLPVIDDFERAIDQMTKNNNAEDNEVLKGIVLIYDKLKKTLEKEGLKLVEVKKGDPFDPEIHEAVAQLPVEDEKMKDKIVDVVEKGYQLGAKNIRYPKVVTGR